MKSLFVSPQAGMCNRFRVICSALLIARLSKRQLYHCWSKEPSLNSDIEIVKQMRESSFATFFADDPDIPFYKVDETTEIDQVFSEWGPGEYWYPMQSSTIRRCSWNGDVEVERTSADSILNSQADNILLETSLCLKPSFMTESEFESALSDIYRSHFKPLPIFQELIERFAQEGPYVGVHIRRADHLQYVREADISVKSWAKIIRQQIGPDEVLYLCSDDEPFVEALIRLISEYRVLRVAEGCSDDPKIRAYLEFLYLSKASRVYGTIGSSFSKVAALFGGRGLVICSVQNPENLWGKLFCHLGIKPQEVICCERPAPRP